jgi:hypothetical protein
MSFDFANIEHEFLHQIANKMEFQILENGDFVVILFSNIKGCATNLIDNFKDLAYFAKNSPQSEINNIFTFLSNNRAKSSTVMNSIKSPISDKMMTELSNYRFTNVFDAYLKHVQKTNNWNYTICVL